MANWDGPPDVGSAVAKAMDDWERRQTAGPVDQPAPKARRDRLERLLRWGAPYREALTLMGESGVEFVKTEAIGYAEEFLGQETKARGVVRCNLLVLAGTNGTGKTTAALHVMESAQPALSYGWRSEQHPRFHHILEMLALGIYGTENEPRRKGLAQCKVLVVDDLGVEPVTEQSMAFINWLLNARYGAPGYTVVTTNLPVEEFHSRYGDHIYDRLRERAHWREISHGSLRGG